MAEATIEKTPVKIEAVPEQAQFEGMEDREKILKAVSEGIANPKKSRQILERLAKIAYKREKIDFSKTAIDLRKEVDQKTLKGEGLSEEDRLKLTLSLQLERDSIVRRVQEIGQVAAGYQRQAEAFKEKLEKLKSEVGVLINRKLAIDGQLTEGRAKVKVKKDKEVIDDTINITDEVQSLQNLANVVKEKTGKEMDIIGITEMVSRAMFDKDFRGTFLSWFGKVGESENFSKVLTSTKRIEHTKAVGKSGLRIGGIAGILFLVSIMKMAAKAESVDKR